MGFPAPHALAVELLRIDVTCGSSARKDAEANSNSIVFMPKMPTYDNVRDESKHVLTSAMSMMG